MSNGIVLPRHRRLMDAAGMPGRTQDTKIEEVGHTPVAWLHEPTGNVFKDGECQTLIATWQKQFAGLVPADEIAADFVPLFKAEGRAS